MVLTPLDNLAEDWFGDLWKEAARVSRVNSVGDWHMYEVSLHWEWEPPGR